MGGSSIEKDPLSGTEDRDRRIRDRETPFFLDHSVGIVIRLLTMPRPRASAEKGPTSLATASSSTLNRYAVITKSIGYWVRTIAARLRPQGVRPLKHQDADRNP